MLLKILLLQTSFLSEETFIYVTGDNTFGQDAINKNDSEPVLQFQSIEQSTFGNKQIYKVSLGPSSNFLITTDYDLYAAGSNSKGKLGLPVKNNYERYQLVTYFSDKNIKIVDIAAGKQDTIALDQNGNAYSLGSDFFNDPNTNISIEQIPSDEKFKQVVAYQETYVLLSTNGNIYFYGSPLDQWKSYCNKTCETLTKLPFSGFTPDSISLGQDQLFVITTSNQVYVSGDYQDPTSCLGDIYNNNSLFNIVDKDFNVIQIVQGKSHTLMLSSDGDIYGCGSNSYNQLGNIVDTKSKIQIPTKVNQDIDDVRSIAATSYGSWMMKNDELYSVGHQDYGELAFGSSKKLTRDQWTKINIDNMNFDEIDSIVASDKNSIVYAHDFKSDKLSTGAIVGIVIGCIFGVILIVSIIYFVYHYRKGKNATYANLDSQTAKFDEEW